MRLDCRPYLRFAPSSLSGPAAYPHTACLLGKPRPDFLQPPLNKAPSYYQIRSPCSSWRDSSLQLITTCECNIKRKGHIHVSAQPWAAPQKPTIFLCTVPCLTAEYKTSSNRRIRVLGVAVQHLNPVATQLPLIEPRTRSPSTHMYHPAHHHCLPSPVAGSHVLILRDNSTVLLHAQHVPFDDRDPVSWSVDTACASAMQSSEMAKSPTRALLISGINERLSRFVIDFIGYWVTVRRQSSGWSWREAALHHILSRW